MDNYPLLFIDYRIARAPDCAGVYALYDGEMCIYCGRAEGGGATIRSRLLDHKAGNDGPSTQRATHFNYEVTSSPISRERDLLEEHKRIYRRLPRGNTLKFALVD